MTPLPSYYLNGVSLATLGFRPIPTEAGRRSGLTLTRDYLDVPGALGQLPAGFGPRATARTIVVDGEVRSTDRAAVLEAIRQILAHAGRGPVDLRCVDAMDRVITVERVDVAAAGVFAPSLLSAQRDGHVRLQFTAAEPAWRDLTPQLLAIGQVATACPLGYGIPSTWTLDIFGSAAGDVVNPQVIYEDAAGTTVASFTLTGTLVSWATDATTRYRITTEGLAPRIRKMVAGAWTDADNHLTAGTLFQLSPHDGWPAGAQYPTVRLFDASARATGLLTYTRRHEL
jgi:hypothetical protein